MPFAAVVAVDDTSGLASELVKLLGPLQAYVVPEAGATELLRLSEPPAHMVAGVATVPVVPPTVMVLRAGVPQPVL